MLMHPLMLAWVGGAVVPLVLHLFSRSRYRAVPWGAMMFLTGDGAGTQHAARARQWVLLGLRMGLIGLLAVALARPVISAKHSQIPTGGLTTGGPAAVVIVLDDSASMGYETGGKTRLDQAREVTLQILTALKPGDLSTLLIAGTHDFQQLLAPSADLQTIAARVADLQPDTGSVDLASELTRAADLLEHAAPADHEIYVITDRQALNWRGINDAFRQHWASRRAAGPPFKMTLFPVGGDEADNIAIDGFDLPDRVVFRDQQSDLQARIRNYGPAPVTSVPVTVWTGSRPLADVVVTIPPHSMRVVNVPIRFGEIGSHVISAALKSTGLTTDDRLDYSVDVVDPPQVLLVGQKPPTTRPTSPLLSLLRGRRQKPNEAEHISTIDSTDLDADAEKGVNVIVLDDVDGLSPYQTSGLLSFVSAGGGIALIPGTNVGSDPRGSSIYQGGNELLPIRLQAPVSLRKPKLIEISQFDRQNSLFRFVNIQPAPFARIPINRYFQVGARSGTVRVLARFSNNDPFIVETQIGRGRVLLVTTPIDPNWNALPGAAITTSLLQSMVRYLDQGAGADRNLLVRQPIHLTTDQPVEGLSATVQLLPGVQREPAMVNHTSDRTEIHFANTNRPGVYRLGYRTGGREKTVSFVVNASHGDSDLSPLTAEQWQTMADRVGFERVDLLKTTAGAAIDSERGGREIWIDLIGGVLLLMLLETLLSRWWSQS